MALCRSNLARPQVRGGRFLPQACLVVWRVVHYRLEEYGKIVRAEGCGKVGVGGAERVNTSVKNSGVPNDTWRSTPIVDAPPAHGNSSVTGLPLRKSQTQGVNTGERGLGTHQTKP